MAGLNLGAPAPAVSPSPKSTRTKRLHGNFLLGDARFVVASSRQRDDGPNAIVIGAGGKAADRLLITGRCTPQQARVIARALLQAAEAIDNAQRAPHIDRIGGAA